MYTIQNQFIKITVKPLGAELTSIYSKTQNREILWQADANFWGRHAPILFPIVGQVRNGKYTINEQEFNLSQHGFARDQTFTAEKINYHTLQFKLTQNQSTIKLYPFKFTLTINYTINRNKLSVYYTVENNDDKNMPFSIGAHPGYNLPFDKNSNINDYSLIFNKNEKIDRIIFENGLLNGKKELNYLNNSNTINLNETLFDQDALIFKDLNSTQIELRNNISKQNLKLNFSGFPYLGIWSKPKSNAPFICIEPWYGITDSIDSSTEFAKKEGRIVLKKEATFTCNYSLDV